MSGCDVCHPLATYSEYKQTVPIQHQQSSSNREMAQEVVYEETCIGPNAPFAMKDNVAYSTVKIAGISLKQSK